MKAFCCQVCGQPLREPSRWRGYCSRECLLVGVEFGEFVELKFILINSRWFGGPGLREEPLEEYLRGRMRDAVGVLSTSSELLAGVLIEILRAIAVDDRAPRADSVDGLFELGF